MRILQSAPLEEETFRLPPDLLKTLGIDTLSILIQRVALLVEKGVPPAGLAMALQIWYRTLSGNKFNESIESVIRRANFSRNYALRGLSILMQLDIVTRTKRQGFTDEYEFTDCLLWQKYETPIPEKDTQEPKGNLVQFPTENSSEPVETEPIPVKDNPETDTPTIWRRTEDATRYCQIPPIHDQATGVEIQRQMDSEGLTAQKVVSRAVAFSKVPLMLLETFGAIGRKLAEGFSPFELGSPEPSLAVPVNVESAIKSLAGTMGRTTSRPSVPKLYGKGEDKIEYFQDSKLKEYGVNLNDENLINVALAANSKDFEMATDCFLNWIVKQKTDDEGNVLKIDRLGNVQKTTATQKFINAINYKWKPHGYEEKVASEKLQNASAYSNTPASVMQSYKELIEEALSSDDGDFIRTATMKIVPLCNENEEFFGFDFAKRCFDVASKNPKSILINSIHSMVKRFGDKWGVVMNANGQVVAV